MQLKSLYYSENRDTDQEWILEECELDKIGLFVAKNATGKTRTLNALKGLSLIWSKNQIYSNCHFIAVFKEDQNTFKYDVKFGDDEVLTESLTKNEKELITRDPDGVTKFLFEDLGKYVTTKIPNDDLAISRQDELQHPYLTELTSWADNTISYFFGSDMSKKTFTISRSVSDKNKSNQNDNKAPTSALFLRGLKNYGDEFKQSIISDMNSINYQIEDVDINEVSNISEMNNLELSEIPKCIFIKEKLLNTYIPQHLLSQGMFRALAIIINLNYLQFQKLKGCILIDDVGEGLDFERSSELIRLIIRKAESSFSQLFMTTNDKFVMNVVPLKYWNVIVRTGHVCNILNNNNSQEIFEEFKFTGLNNFDFLSLDFYKKDSLH